MKSSSFYCARRKISIFTNLGNQKKSMSLKVKTTMKIIKIEHVINQKEKILLGWKEEWMIGGRYKKKRMSEK